MRTRIVGGIGFVLGLAMVIVLLMDDQAIGWKPLLGGLAFMGLGGWHLLTGGRAASVKEFVVDGKLRHDEPAPPKS